MSRDATLAAAATHFDSGAFLRDLSRRVAIRTESQNPASGPELQRYLADEMQPSLAALGFRSTIHPNPEPAYGPFLIAHRVEDPALPTVLMYGHGDVIHLGDEFEPEPPRPRVLARIEQELAKLGYRQLVPRARGDHVDGRAQPVRRKRVRAAHPFEDWHQLGGVAAHQLVECSRRCRVPLPLLVHPPDHLDRPSRRCCCQCQDQAA